MTNLNKLLFVSLFLTAATASADVTFSTFSANGTFTVPAGVTSLTVECWGGGGGGGTETGTSGAGGASGGLYAKTTGITTTPTTVYAVMVGSAGTAGLGGGPSIFGSSLCWAAGGTGVASDATTGASPKAISTSTGTVKFLGGFGHSYTSGSFGAGGGSSGGRTANGNFTTLANASDNSAGAAPDTGAGVGGAGAASGNAAGQSPASGWGGGGGGAHRTSGGTKAGGTGDPGQVVVQYTVSTRRRVMQVN